MRKRADKIVDKFSASTLGGLTSNQKVRLADDIALGMKEVAGDTLESIERLFAIMREDFDGQHEQLRESNPAKAAIYEEWADRARWAEKEMVGVVRAQREHIQAEMDKRGEA